MKIECCGLTAIDYLLALILLATLANHDTKFLHTLKQGRNGVCFEQQTMSNVVHWLGILLPQHHQNEVLRIGNTQLIQHRRVSLCNETCRRIETEAYLVVKL